MWIHTESHHQSTLTWIETTHGSGLPSNRFGTSLVQCTSTVDRNKPINFDQDLHSPTAVTVVINSPNYALMLTESLSYQKRRVFVLLCPRKITCNVMVTFRDHVRLAPLVAVILAAGHNSISLPKLPERNKQTAHE